MDSDPNSAQPDDAAASDSRDLDRSAPVRSSASRHFTWRYRVRRLLVCNPFFLCSAALLLYGINRLSVDPKFLSNETHNLLFNFSALQFYEVLVVVTALVLARRRVWYDSALLVVVDNGLVLIPFMLLSQATLIDSRLAWGLTLAGGVVAVARFCSVRRWYPEFNLPSRALLLGAIILILNLVLPRLFHVVIADDVDDWRGPNLIAWYVALPLLAATANLLPRPRRYGGINPERHWLPLFNFGLWLAGSAVHVWCLTRITNFSFSLALAAPLAVACGWTMWNRLSDCMPNPSPKWQEAMLLLVFFAPFMAFKEPRLFFVLAAVNGLAFGILWLAGPSLVRQASRELALVTPALLFASMPGEWVQVWLPIFSQREYVAGAIILYCVGQSLRSRRPEVGVLGALAMAIGIGWLARDWTFHAALQASLMFFVTHSLRWRANDYLNAKVLRWLAASLWIVDAAIWTYQGDRTEACFVAIMAVIAAAAWAIHYWRTGQREPLIVLLAATLTLLSGPVNWFCRHSSEGLVALAGSLILFAVGITVAWTRHRWEQWFAANRSPPEAE